jgi:hypothetical protein
MSSARSAKRPHGVYSSINNFRAARAITLGRMGAVGIQASVGSDVE